MRFCQVASPQSFSRVVRAVALLAATLAATARALAVDTADPAALVKEINPSTARVQLASAQPLIASGGNLFLAVGDANNGTELWVSDGSPDGTQLVREITPGQAYTSLEDLEDVNGTLFFSASANMGVFELWKSDGTEIGTTVVRSPSAGGPRNPTSLTNVAGTLYFVATDAEGKTGLWRSNGTAAGTSMVKLIQATRLTAVGDQLFFIGQDEVYGRELWVSDGTEAGTRIVQEFNPSGDSFNDPSSYDPNLTAVGDKLYFITTEHPLYEYLWRTDGTAGGTTRIEPAATGLDLHAGELENAGGTLFFRGYSTIDDFGMLSTGIWKTDGTPSGTVEIKSFATGNNPALIPSPLKAVGGNLFFVGNNDPSGTYYLWFSDGTTIGTRELTNARIDPQLTTLTDVAGTLFYVGKDADGDIELWRSDGIEAGTARIKNINPAGSSSPSHFVPLGGTLFFSADTGQGFAFWKSDGSEAGTVLVKDPGLIPAGIDPLGIYQQYDYEMTDLNGQLFFVADDGTHGYELWISDGSDSGTRMVKDINPVGSSGPFELTRWNDRLYFLARSDTSAGLWVSDGTAGGTQPLKVSSLPLPPGEFPPDFLTVAGDALYFLTSDPSGETLWKTDGSASGTIQVATIPRPTSGGLARSLMSAGGRLFFVASDDAHGQELWTSDGTAGGTHILKDIITGSNGLNPTGLTDVNGTLFFFVQIGDGPQLWKSDGTAGGTVQVKDLGYAGNGGFNPANFTVVGSRLFFTAGSRIEDLGLYVSDGSVSGTLRLKDIRHEATPPSLANINDRLLFAIDDGEHGRELWKSDGTLQGTTLVKDINAGSIGSAADNIRQVTNDGWALFAASDGLGGVELWSSNGTAAGTQRLQDIAPGAPSSNPTSFLSVGSRVFFVADNGSTGPELWSLDHSILVDLPENKVYLPFIGR
jgi:ELWxxDGT repeat protein